MKIISVTNQKGGVGKTTTTFNLGLALSKLGQRVLMVDNDPQANLSSYSIAEIPDGQLTIDEVYLDKRGDRLTIESLIEIKERLSLLPSDGMLSGVEYYLVSKPEKERVLKRRLRLLEKHFDIAIIDNPPSLNLLTLNALVASDYALVPAQLEFFSLEGLSQLRSTIEDVRNWNSDLKILGILPTLVHARRKSSQEVMELIQKEFGNKVFETVISNSAAVADSTGAGRSVLDSSPKSKPALEFLSLAKEVLKRLGETNGKEKLAEG